MEFLSGKNKIDAIHEKVTANGETILIATVCHAIMFSCVPSYQRRMINHASQVQKGECTETDCFATQLDILYRAVMANEIKLNNGIFVTLAGKAFTIKPQHTAKDSKFMPYNTPKDTAHARP